MTDLAPAAAPQDDAAPAWLTSWCPSILLHVLYPDSRKVGFGWWLFIIATLAAFFLKNGAAPMLDASNWLICVAMSSGLIGAGTLIDGKLELETAKLALKETPNAPVPPAGS